MFNLLSVPPASEIIIPPAVGVELVCVSNAFTETVSAVVACTPLPIATAFDAVASDSLPIEIELAPDALANLPSETVLVTPSAALPIITAESDVNVPAPDPIAIVPSPACAPLPIAIA